ncbi:hypothetical protein WA026_002200 [Henosepilachna vigintioctopunctata]|uniref:Uncharacterized protein n=1 Tax=Henosepilachna vigintioctopunctata TaxID=420089 RepID=A0AAW1TZJ6_9CUCU
MKFLIILYVIFSSLFALSVATLNFKKCYSKDLSCLKDAIQDALPKLKDGIDALGVPPLDPLLVPKMSNKECQFRYK